MGLGGIGEGYLNVFNCIGGMVGYIDIIVLGNYFYRFFIIKVK